MLQRSLRQRVWVKYLKFSILEVNQLVMKKILALFLLSCMLFSSCSIYRNKINVDDSLTSEQIQQIQSIEPGTGVRVQYDKRKLPKRFQNIESNFGLFGKGSVDKVVRFRSSVYILSQDCKTMQCLFVSIALFHLLGRQF